jgi:hypothetical protein
VNIDGGQTIGNSTSAHDFSWDITIAHRKYSRSLYSHRRGRPNNHAISRKLESSRGRKSKIGRQRSMGFTTPNRQQKVICPICTATRTSDENVWSAARLQGGSWSKRLVCANVFGLWLEISSPGHDEMRTCLSLLARRSWETILVSRLMTRRYDCSFVLAALCRLRGRAFIVVVRESWSAQRFQAEGVFSALPILARFLVGSRCR